MALDAHLESLNQRHQDLEMALAAELKRPQADENKTHELKRLKLRVKDQIAQLEREDSRFT